MCCEPVLDPEEVKYHPQVVHRGLFVNLPHPQAGEVEVLRNPVKLPNSPYKADIVPPGFGEHTREILLNLDMSEQEIDALAKAGVI